MKVLSLCAGIGGFDLAAEWAGMEVVGQVEIDPFCLRVLARHWPDVRRVPDLFDVKGDEFGPVDLITAGFPCQPYSLAGKRGGASDDRAIWPEVRRVVEVIRPRWCCFENVVGLISMGLDDCLADMEGLGYEARAVVLPACAVGAWHRRDRVWIIATNAEGDLRRASGDDGLQASHGGGSIVPYAARELLHGGRGTRDRWPEFANGREAVPDAAISGGGTRGTGLNGSRWPDGFGGGSERGGGGQGVAQSRVCGVPDALPEGLDGYWDTEWADTPRVATGVPNRAARLKALGNSIVPTVAYQILAEIMACEEALNDTAPSRRPAAHPLGGLTR